MRLFIAIGLSGEMKDALTRVQRQMAARRVTGSYTPVENMHLTLAFIGEYPDPEAVDLPPVRPFTLALEGFGSFGDLWWAGLAGSPALEGYVRTLRHELNRAGIPFDGKRFSPHITLVRRAVAGAKGFPGIHVPAVTARVERVSLMRSDRGKSGMIYTPLGCRE